MLNRPSELDEAEVRLKMRLMYKDVGVDGAIKCLYELIYSATILIDIILEERTNESRWKN